MQINNAEAYDITHTRLRGWKDMLMQFTPALVGMDAVDLNFVLTVWKQFLDRKY